MNSVNPDNICTWLGPNQAPMTHSEHLDYLIFAVRELVGKPYDKGMGGRPERHERKRRLTITAISGAYEYASHVVVAIMGTPTRGHVIVNLTHGDLDSRHLTTGRRLTPKQCALLRQFISAVSGTQIHMVPAGFRWSDMP